MDDILKLLYDAPLGKHNSSISPESPLHNAIHLRAEHQERLIASLSEEQLDWFEAYADAEADVADLRSFRRFTYGFQLGALLMQAVSQGEKEIMPER